MWVVMATGYGWQWQQAINAGSHGYKLVWWRLTLLTSCATGGKGQRKGSGVTSINDLCLEQHKSLHKIAEMLINSIPGISIMD